MVDMPKIQLKEQNKKELLAILRALSQNELVALMKDMSE